MLDPQSINALYKLLENFLKFGHFFKLFFASLKSLIDCTLLKYQPSPQFGQFLILNKIFQI